MYIHMLNPSTESYFGIHFFPSLHLLSCCTVNKILDFIYLPSTHMHNSPWWREASGHALLPSLALQEMSPIDIVPMAPQSHEETFHDNTQSDIGYMNHGYGSMDRSGTVPRRPTNGHVKHVSYHMPSQLMWYVRTYVCAYCMYVCTVYMYVCTVHMYVCTVHMYVCTVQMYVCTVNMYVCTVHIYVCTVHMYVHTVCMYVQYRHVYAWRYGGMGASFPLLLQISVFTQYRLPTNLSLCEG